MIIFISGHKFHFEIENLCRMFFPNSEIKLNYEYSDTDEDYLFTSMISENGVTILNANIRVGDNSAQFSDSLQVNSD